MSVCVFVCEVEPGCSKHSPSVGQIKGRRKQNQGCMCWGVHKTGRMSKRSAGIFSACVCVCMSVDGSVTTYASLAHSDCL